MKKEAKRPTPQGRVNGIGRSSVAGGAELHIEVPSVLSSVRAASTEDHVFQCPPGERVPSCPIKNVFAPYRSGLSAYGLAVVSGRNVPPVGSVRALLERGTRRAVRVSAFEDRERFSLRAPRDGGG
ncbi:hypothetical protein SKAU_G00382810 [Synaphobranchus kaupii]|uniref:Uncharacterized protein n=1 Tax=Synaphobranchus kaupii TaxID=118154 RepID=A0A9Q1EE84_SYNKA|nr:hypothetical protein SKAU_G00382810 [Synaphobranchus kaupii]